MPARKPDTYEIRLFDKTLVEFSFEPSSKQGVKLHHYDEDALSLMPPGIALSDQGVRAWLDNRAIPSNRKNAALICRQLGFDISDKEALYKTSLGLSLNDSYWVVPAGFQGSFDEFNLYENSFSDALGALAVSGEPMGDISVGNTPELSTEGTLRKGWRIVDGMRMLYKGSSSKDIPGEAHSEYLASLVASSLGMHAVRYGLDTWADELCSTCACFSTKERSYVSFFDAFHVESLEDTLSCVARLGREDFERFCDMIAFDMAICNTDRHQKNYGIMRNSHTGAALHLAPVFDNGRSLFFNVVSDDPSLFSDELALSSVPFGFARQADLLAATAGPRQIALLEEMQTKRILGNTQVSPGRVRVLNEFLARHIDDLLEDLRPVDHDALFAEALARRITVPAKHRKLIHAIDYTPRTSDELMPAYHSTANTYSYKRLQFCKDDFEVTVVDWAGVAQDKRNSLDVRVRNLRNNESFELVFDTMSRTVGGMGLDVLELDYPGDLAVDIDRVCTAEQGERRER